MIISAGVGRIYCDRPTQELSNFPVIVASFDNQCQVIQRIVKARINFDGAAKMLLGLLKFIFVNQLGGGVEMSDGLIAVGHARDSIPLSGRWWMRRRRLWD